MRERVIATLTQQSYSTTRTGTYTALVSNSSLLAGTHCTTVGWFDCSEHPAILFGPDGQPATVFTTPAWFLTTIERRGS